MSHLFVPAYLQGFETQTTDTGKNHRHQFQHTYKGSKLFYLSIFLMKNIRSSIPTRVRNGFKPSHGHSNHQSSSSIPTRVRNFFLSFPVSSSLMFQHTYKGSKRFTDHMFSPHKKKFQHTYKGSKLILVHCSLKVQKQVPAYLQGFETREL